MFSIRVRSLLLATIFAVLGIIIVSFSAGMAADLDANLISKAVVLYQFLGDGRDSSDKGQNELKNLQFTIPRPNWQKPQGIKLLASRIDVAKLPEPLPGLEFDGNDFTIFIEMKLAADAPDGSWAVIETNEGENEPGGFSLKLNLNEGKFEWRFHLDNNDREAALGGDASSLRKPTKLSVVREKGTVTIFSVSDEEIREGTSAEIPNAPRKNGRLTFGSFPGTLIGAAIWRTALQRKELTVGWMD